MTVLHLICPQIHAHFGIGNSARLSVAPTKMLLKLTLTAVSLILANYLYRFTTNYIIAKRLALPIVICPFTWQNPLWVLTARTLHIWRLSHLPGLGWLRYSHLGWSLHDKHHSRIRFGPAFVIVSARNNEVVLHDPAAVTEVLGKYKKWERPRDAYKIFSLLGENVDSVSSEEWPRHRKVLNAGFVEANLRVVWESVERQVGQWLREGTMTFEKLTEATDTISANVLVKVGFGKDYAFADQGLTDVGPGRGMSFIKAIRFIMSNLSLAWVVKHKRVPAFLKSKKVATVRDCMNDLKFYLTESIRRPHSQFINAMLEANATEKQTGREGLSEEELCGNLFILLIAGFDTSSYAISFTIAMLSVSPDTQEWIREEVVAGDYEVAYPKMLRCRAAIMETLRVHTPTPSLPRHSSKPETLRIAGHDYVIPEDTIITSNIPSIHNDPEIWGDDAGLWKPQRWIEVINGTEILKERFEMMAWSTGPRVCPGKKFSLVEAAAVICSVLKDYRLVGTSNMEGTLCDFEYTVTPKPRRPESASVDFVKVQSVL